MKNSKLLIFGTGILSEIVYHYFDNFSSYSIEGFVVDKEFIRGESFMGAPVYDSITMERDFPSKEFEVFVAIGYSKMNITRQKKYIEMKSKGYRLPNFIAPDLSFANNVTFGDNNFILEKNNIQPFVSIGNNNIFWSGNHIGHHSKIGSNNFFSSHVVVSSRVMISENCFFGVNSTIVDGITINSHNLIGANTLILKDTGPYEVYSEKGSEKSRVPSNRISFR